MCVVCVVPAAARAQAEQAGPAELSCAEQAALDPLLAGALETARVHAGDGLAVDGVAAIDAAALWAWLEADPETHALRPGAALPEGATAALLLKLRRSGLFAALALEPGAAGTLRLRLTEQPLVTAAAAAGLRVASPADLLLHALGDPAASPSRPREPVSALGFLVQRRRTDDGGGGTGCALLPAEARWFARVEGGEVRPGLLRGGLAGARLRAARWLREGGYPHSTVKGSISTGGLLLIEADEGNLISLEVRGVSPPLRAGAERTLGFHPGDLFAGLELHRALARLAARYPFITLDISRVAVPGVPPGLAGVQSAGLELGELHLDLAYATGGGGLGAADLRATGGASGALEQLGAGRFALWLRASPATAEVQLEQLLRHTPATGFAPGLAATLHFWDAEDRARLAIDGGYAFNTKRTARAALPGDGAFESLSAQEGFDFLAGARLSVPAWDLAELGAQLYALTDTNDGWRMSDLNSYVHSALAATPDRDYFRRAGATLLATVHLFDRLTLGTELHRDRFDPLPNPRVWSLSGADNPPLPAAPVTAGRFDSVLLRAEWSSDELQLAGVGTLFRHPETSLARREATPAFSTLATLEAGDWFKLLTDSRLQLAPAGDLLLRLRLRVAAGSRLPLQKQEALGGWSALRGYDFKELRGDASALASAEARWLALGAFVDLGSVHAPDGWLAPRAGAGLQLFLDRLGSLEVAWRLDGNGGARPSARALLGQSF